MRGVRGAGSGGISCGGSALRKNGAARRAEPAQRIPPSIRPTSAGEWREAADSSSGTPPSCRRGTRTVAAAGSIGARRCVACVGEGGGIACGGSALRKSGAPRVGRNPRSGFRRPSGRRAQANGGKRRILLRALRRLSARHADRGCGRIYRREADAWRAWREGGGIACGGSALRKSGALRVGRNPRSGFRRPSGPPQLSRTRPRAGVRPGSARAGSRPRARTRSPVRAPPLPVRRRRRGPRAAG